MPRPNITLWLAVLSELKRLRGNNELRARQIDMQHTGKLFLAVATRGAQEPAEAVAITVGSTGAETYYEYQGKRTFLAAYPNVAAFAAAAAAITRQQAPHVRTYDDKVEYK